MLCGQMGYGQNWNLGELDDVKITGKSHDDDTASLNFAYLQMEQDNPWEEQDFDPCTYNPCECDPSSCEEQTPPEEVNIGAQVIANEVPYVPLPDDKKISNIKTTMLPQLQNACVSSSLEYISEILGKKISENDISKELAQTYNTIVWRDGVNLSDRGPLINTFFNTQPFSNFIDAIDAGLLVTTVTYATSPSGSGHNVVVVGYQSDGDLIYMNPSTGILEEAPTAYFSIMDAIVITSVK